MRNSIIFTLAMIIGVSVCFTAPPIYVSIVVHIEENPDYAGNTILFFNKRNQILYLANMLDKHGILNKVRIPKM